MEFRTGDDVVHPDYGVGSIMRLEERQLAGVEMQQHYVLAIGKATVWVPVRADGSTALRTVTSKHELEQYRRVLTSCPTTLQRDHNKRRLEIHERLKPGSFLSMCEIVRDLTARGWYRPLGGGDAAQLQKVRDNLLREWAVAAVYRCRRPCKKLRRCCGLAGTFMGCSSLRRSNDHVSIQFSL
jgi:CarD family transcriptional regulator